MTQTRKLSFSGVLLMLVLLAVGGFHEYVSCAASVVMCLYLAIRLIKRKELNIRKSLLSLAVLLLCAGYGLTVFWAVDRGMAWIGFWKFLPAALYLLCLWQNGESDSILELLPYFAGGLVLICLACMQVEVLRPFVTVADRLAGPFQYPNTFAVFLLVCELLLLKKEKKSIPDCIAAAVLILGILFSGSRTVFVLFLVSNCAIILVTAKRKARKWILIALCCGAILIGAALLLAPSTSVLHRYLTISWKESTFVGRILYVLDALPLLLKYPFGMGYMGYYYIQNSIQTGVYSVTGIHNDFFQFFLDAGWIPGIAFLAAVISYFFKKTVPAADKLIVGTLCLHTLFDFNLQFIGVFFLLLLLLDRGQSEKTVAVKISAPASAGFAAAAVAALYMGTALLLSHTGFLETADRLYPWNTQNKLSMLEQTEDLDSAEAIADQILSQNTQHYAAYSVKAKCAYAQGDFESLIRYKHTVFEKNPFGYEEYEEYCVMLINGIMLYERAGDTASAKICRQELITAQKRLAANENRLSTLGAMIADQPVFTLSQTVQDYIKQTEGE